MSLQDKPLKDLLASMARNARDAMNHGVLCIDPMAPAAAKAYHEQKAEVERRVQLGIDRAAELQRMREGVMEIVDGLSYVDDATDPCAVAGQTIAELQDLFGIVDRSQRQPVLGEHIDAFARAVFKPITHWRWGITTNGEAESTLRVAAEKFLATLKQLYERTEGDDA